MGSESHLMPVWVSWCHCTKWPQTWWLRTTHAQKSKVSLTGWKSRCQRGRILLEPERTVTSSPFLVSGGLVHSLTSNPFLLSPQPRPSIVTRLSSSSVVKSPSGSFSQGHLWWRLGPSLIIQDNLPISKSLVPSAESMLRSEVAATGSGFWALEISSVHYSAGHGTFNASQTGWLRGSCLVQRKPSQNLKIFVKSKADLP